MRIIITDFPFPPSSNAIRGSFFDRNATRFDKKKKQNIQGKMRHYDTAIYKSYKQSCEVWAWEKWREIKHAAIALKEKTKDQKVMVKIDSYFGFHHGSVWSKEGKLKQTDTSNRIKSCHDELAKYLTIDDLIFNIGKAEKCWVYDHEPERVILVLTLEKMRSLAEIEKIILKSVHVSKKS